MIQPKVSMVMPCYNKVEYIGGMFDSILAQDWNNIELILVNDGSTDGTREVITEYELKFRNCGFELAIIDQENAGVCAAVKTGLERMTGDYICMVDSDDELLPDYVSTLAGWLDKHKEDQWVVCDGDKQRWISNEAEITDEISDVSSFRNLVEKYLLMRNYGTVWLLMIRADYLRQAGIIDCMELVERSPTHEPQVWLPVLLGRGKGTYIPKALYKLNMVPESLSLFNIGGVVREESLLTYAKLYRESIIRVLGKLGINDKKLYLLADIREVLELFNKGSADLYEKGLERLFEILMRDGLVEEAVSSEKFIDYGGVSTLLEWLWTGLVATDFIGRMRNIKKNANRVIGYGALGKRASRLLPLLDGTEWKPTELWDKGGDGLTVKRPDIRSLGEGDIVLVFPKNQAVIEEVETEFNKTGANILYDREISELINVLPIMKYPRFM
jgi:glycosyltransferase involved in cell wall biosynthesis